jgi:hypothetical protein
MTRGGVECVLNDAVADKLVRNFGGISRGRSALRFRWVWLRWGYFYRLRIAAVLWVRRLSLKEYLAGFVTVPGLISLLMFFCLCGNAGRHCEAARGRAAAIS